MTVNVLAVLPQGVTIAWMGLVIKIRYKIQAKGLACQQLTIASISTTFQFSLRAECFFANANMAEFITTVTRKPWALTCWSSPSQMNQFQNISQFYFMTWFLLPILTRSLKSIINKISPVHSSTSLEFLIWANFKQRKILWTFQQHKRSIYFWARFAFTLQTRSHRKTGAILLKWMTGINPSLNPWLITKKLSTSPLRILQKKTLGCK